MRRALILCLFLMLGQMSGNCATPFFAPLQPMNGAAVNSYGNNLANATTPYTTQNSENYPDINKVENSIFGRTYANQNISERLSRIEKSLFTTSYPNASSAQRIDNIILNLNQINKYPNISRNELTKLEKKVLNQTYPQNSAERRIERLEQQLLGASQSGDMEARYETIKIAAKNYNPNIASNDAIDNFPMTPQRGGWRGITQALGGSMFGGSMTGFTPPIMPFNNNNYTNGYGNNNYNNYSSNAYSNQNANSYTNPYNAYPSGYGMYRGNRTNHGYQDNYQSYGSGTGVTILD